MPIVTTLTLQLEINNIMNHVTTGIRRILEFPFVYETFQTLVGHKAFIRRLVKDFIQPFPGARILDIGCGTCAILDELPNDIEYVGVDLNPKYVESAKSRYKDNNATFYCGRVDDMVDKEHKFGQFDIALAIGILHHIGDNEANNLFNGAQYLKDTGYLITMDPVYVENQSAIARYVMSKDRGQNIRTLEGYLKLAKTRFSSVESFIFTNAIRLPYTILIMRASK
jgi:2-polyprenyl-3-methyl-5-hydroxy-6-metoxy-1,4-benzoquinol methylase